MDLYAARVLGVTVLLWGSEAAASYMRFCTTCENEGEIWIC